MFVFAFLDPPVTSDAAFDSVPDAFPAGCLLGSARCPTLLLGALIVAVAGLVFSSRVCSIPTFILSGPLDVRRYKFAGPLEDGPSSLVSDLPAIRPSVSASGICLVSGTSGHDSKLSLNNTVSAVAIPCSPDARYSFVIRLPGVRRLQIVYIQVAYQGAGQNVHFLEQLL